MQLGIIAKPTGESFDYAKSHGLEFLEFDIDRPHSFALKDHPELANNGVALLDRVDEFKGHIARTGVAVGAVGRWGSVVITPDGKVDEREFEQVKALMEFARQVGAKSYLISVNYTDQLTYFKNLAASIDYLNRAVEEAGKDLQVCIVNCAMVNNYIRKPEEWRIVLPEVPGLKIKYDPSHSFVHGGQTGAYMEEAFEFGDRFGHVHIKGTIQGSKFSHGSGHFSWIEKVPEARELLFAEMEESFRYYDNPPAGMDSIDWPGFMAILYKHGYDGMLSIEPHSRTWQGDLGERGVNYAIKYIRGLMI